MAADIAGPGFVMRGPDNGKKVEKNARAIALVLRRAGMNEDIAATEMNRAMGIFHNAGNDADRLSEAVAEALHQCQKGKESPLSMWARIKGILVERVVSVDDKASVCDFVNEFVSEGGSIDTYLVLSQLDIDGRSNLKPFVKAILDGVVKIECSDEYKEFQKFKGEVDRITEGVRKKVKESCRNCKVVSICPDVKMEGSVKRDEALEKAFWLQVEKSGETVGRLSGKIANAFGGSLQLGISTSIDLSTKDIRQVARFGFTPELAQGLSELTEEDEQYLSETLLNRGSHLDKRLGFVRDLITDAELYTKLNKMHEEINRQGIVVEHLKRILKLLGEKEGE